MTSINYNPDVLLCLANLSNDEVFTPPELANSILDLLPKDIWKNKDAKFLDPVSKSGVFLREITKRLIVGLEDEIPDLQTRVNHILKNQVFGIAITELTSLLSKRTLYCAKSANSDKSICNEFKNEDGNIRYKNINHTFKSGKCEFCGANEDVYSRDDDMETHAYEFIHTNNPKEIFNMKFDVIVGNPPYQLTTGGTSAQAVPLYHKFVQQAKKLNPRFLTMIIPARWYAGGMGLGEFRKEMLSDKRIKNLVDYPNARDCFSGIELRGGVCYFLLDRDYVGDCNYTNISNGSISTMLRNLNEYDIFIRWNQALKIVKKVQKVTKNNLSEIVSSVSPFGIPTSIRGKEKDTKNIYTLHTSGGQSYIEIGDIKAGFDYIDKYKVLLSRPISGNIEVPPFKVIALLKTLEPKEVCTHTYLIAGNFDNKKEANNLEIYLKTKFVRFLLVQSISGMDISKDKFIFVPIQNFNETWTDEKLYKKYGLSQEEIDFIESMIRPMDSSDE
jgi:site-specific DNA-methyltransferase (adenine-specific)